MVAERSAPDLGGAGRVSLPELRQRRRRGKRRRRPRRKRRRIGSPAGSQFVQRPCLPIDQFVIRQNIAIYNRQLGRETDPARRELLRRLLDGERAKRGPPGSGGPHFRLRRNPGDPAVIRLFRQARTRAVCGRPSLCEPPRIPEVRECLQPIKLLPPGPRPRRSATTMISATISSACGSGRSGSTRPRCSRPATTSTPRRSASSTITSPLPVRPARRASSMSAAAGGRCSAGSSTRRSVKHAVGLTLSSSQAAFVRERAGPEIEVREESWRDHKPDAPYDAIISVGAFEHFARPGLSPEEKLAAYRAFFGFCRDSLKTGGLPLAPDHRLFGVRHHAAAVHRRAHLPRERAAADPRADRRRRPGLRAGRAPERPRPLCADAGRLGAGAGGAARRGGGDGGRRRRGGIRPLPPGLRHGLQARRDLPLAHELPETRPGDLDPPRRPQITMKTPASMSRPGSIAANTLALPGSLPFRSWIRRPASSS